MVVESKSNCGSKWKHSMLRSNGNRGNFARSNLNSTRRSYYKDNVLYIIVGDKTLQYPPKAGIMLFNSTFDKILLVKNNYHPYPKCQKWGYPKGHLELHELNSECAKRELLEETGLAAVITDYKTVNVNNSKYYIYFTDESIIDQVKPIDTNEINDAQFHAIDTIQELNLNREASVLIKKDIGYLKSLARPLQLV